MDANINYPLDWYHDFWKEMTEFNVFRFTWSSFSCSAVFVFLCSLVRDSTAWASSFSNCSSSYDDIMNKWRHKYLHFMWFRKAFQGEFNTILQLHLGLRRFWKSYPVASKACLTRINRGYWRIGKVSKGKILAIIFMKLLKNRIWIVSYSSTDIKSRQGYRDRWKKYATSYPVMP